MALRDPRSRNSMLNLRSPNPTGSRSYGDPTDMVGDTFHILSKEQLIPQIANRTKNAIAVDRREVFLYQRLREGRRCSCFANGETSPHSLCPICHATGFVGGFLKWGTDLYIFDPTQKWVGVNATISPLLGIPPWFTLEAGSTHGYVEWVMKLRRSHYFGLDSSWFDYRRGEGQIEFLFKLEGHDPSFIIFSEIALKERILIAECGQFRFKVIMSRTVPDDQSPLFQQFWFRALTESQNPVLFVDIPRRQESNVLAEYGALEIFNQIQFAFASDQIQRINLEDMILKLEDMTRWKVIEQSPNDPLNILTSIDIQARKVFKDEAMMRVLL